MDSNFDKACKTSLKADDNSDLRLKETKSEEFVAAETNAKETPESPAPVGSQGETSAKIGEINLLPECEPPDNQASGQSQALAPSKSNFQQGASLLRHRTILATCLALSAGLAVIGALDLHRLVKREVVIDKQFHVGEARQLPDLRSGLRYELERYGSIDRNVHPDDLIPISEALWTGTRYGFADRHGNVVIKPKYEQVCVFEDGLAAVRSPGGKKLWGYIDRRGATVIPPEFDCISSFGDGTALVVKPDGSWLAIDKQGHTKLQLEAPYGQPPFRDGDLFYQPDGAKFGLKDIHGNWVVPPKYDSISPFGDFDAYCEFEVRQPQYAQFNSGVDVGSFSAHFAISPMSTENTNRSRYQVQSSTESSKYFLVEMGNEVGLIDRHGRTLVPTRFDGIASYNQEHAVVRMKKKVGVVDSNGDLVIAPTFDYLTAYGPIMAAFKNGAWLFINQNGDTASQIKVDGVVIPCQAYSNWFQNGLGPILIKNRVGYVNAQGAIAVKPVFDVATIFRDGFANVWDGEAWKLIDTHGNFISPLRFTDSTRFYKGCITSTAEGPLYGIAQMAQVQRTQDRINLAKAALHFTAQDPPRSVGYYNSGLNYPY